jgi:ribonuclease HI
MHTHTPTNTRTREIHCSIKLLQGLNKEGVIQWIPSHCGTEENEWPDFLVKGGTLRKQLNNTNLAFDSSEVIIQNTTKK